MLSYPTVELPSALDGSSKDLVTGIDKWLSSQALRELVSAFGFDAAELGGAELAQQLETFAADHLDFRRGAERNLAPTVSFTPHQQRVVDAASRALGLRDARAPRRRKYDVILVLGGLVRACIVRPRYTSWLLADGLAATEVVALGGFRKLSDDETELARRHGVSAADEFEAMVHGVELAFNVRGSITEEAHGLTVANSRWRVWEAHDERDIKVIAAPSSEPELRRANTVDTYRFWASRYVATAEVPSILVVTNPIYVPYQGCGATQVLWLEYGFAVETIGIDRLAADLGPDTQQFGTQQYVQEIRSAIHGMWNLRQHVTDGRN